MKFLVAVLVLFFVSVSSWGAATLPETYLADGVVMAYTPGTKTSPGILDVRIGKRRVLFQIDQDTVITSRENKRLAPNGLRIGQVVSIRYQVVRHESRAVSISISTRW
jgi:hypothetical protein